MPPSDRFACEWVRERLDAYYDGESGLSDDERLRVARHVESCASCASELALAERLSATLRDMAVPAAPAAAIERAAQEIARSPGGVVRLHARVRPSRWVAVAAALVIVVALAWMGSDLVDRNARSDSLAVEQAAQEAAVAFAYVSKYARRTGVIVQDQAIERLILDPLEKAMEESGVGETKPRDDQS